MGIEKKPIFIVINFFKLHFYIKKIDVAPRVRKVPVMKHETLTEIRGI